MQSLLTFTICVQTLETILPDRPVVEIPEGEHVEEVNLVDYEETRSATGGRPFEAYHEDEDDGSGAGPRVQCAHQ